MPIHNPILTTNSSLPLSVPYVPKRLGYYFTVLGGPFPGAPPGGGGGGMGGSIVYYYDGDFTEIASSLLKKSYEIKKVINDFFAGLWLGSNQKMNPKPFVDKSVLAITPQEIKQNALRDGFKPLEQIGIVFPAFKVIGRYAHYEAALDGDLATFKQAIDAGANLDEIFDDLRRTIFHVAAEGGHLEIVKTLLASDRISDETLNAKDILGLTALHLSAKMGNLKVIQVLLASKRLSPRTLNAKSNTGATALHHAAASGHVEVVQALLASKHLSPTALNEKTNYGGTTLYHAAQRGCIEVVKALLSTNHMTNEILSATDDSGEAAFHRAAANGHFEVVKALLSSNWMTDETSNVKNHKGKTALDVALENIRITVVLSLIQSSKIAHDFDLNDVLLNFIKDRQKDRSNQSLLEKEMTRYNLNQLAFLFEHMNNLVNQSGSYGPFNEDSKIDPYESALKKLGIPDENIKIILEAKKRLTKGAQKIVKTQKKRQHAQLLRSRSVTLQKLAKKK